MSLGTGVFDNILPLGTGVFDNILSLGTMVFDNILYFSIKKITYIKNNKVRELFFLLYYGADGGTRTHMVSRWILRPVRLPVPPHQQIINILLN